MQCPSCNGTGKVRRDGTRKAHVCDMCAGSGNIEMGWLEAAPLFDMYSMVRTPMGYAMMHQHSWQHTLSAMVAMSRLN